jgi:hypothetical protein
MQTTKLGDRVRKDALARDGNPHDARGAALVVEVAQRRVEPLDPRLEGGGSVWAVAGLVFDEGGPMATRDVRWRGWGGGGKWYERCAGIDLRLLRCWAAWRRSAPPPRGGCEWTREWLAEGAALGVEKGTEETTLQSTPPRFFNSPTEPAAKGNKQGRLDEDEERRNERRRMQVGPKRQGHPILIGTFDCLCQMGTPVTVE